MFLDFIYVFESEMNLNGKARMKRYEVCQMADSTKEVSIDNLEKYVNLCSNTDEIKQLEGTKAIRRLTATEVGQTIQQLIDSGVVPVLIRHLARYENPKLQFEATWVITNMASGTSQQTSFIVESVRSSLINRSKSISSGI